MKLLNHLEEWLITSLMGAATMLVFVSVIHRYLSGVPVSAIQDAMLKINLSWTQELTIFMFVWMAKFGAAYGVRKGIHVGVDVVINNLSDKYRKFFIVFGLATGALFTGIVGTLGADFVWSMFHASSTSEDLEVPMWIVYLAIPLGSYLMCFRFLEVGYHFLRNGTLVKSDHAHIDNLDTEVTA